VSRWWCLKYRFAGKEKRISLGVYPDVGLKKARDRRDEMRKLVADGIDPKRGAQTPKTQGLMRFSSQPQVWTRRHVCTLSTMTSSAPLVRAAPPFCEITRIIFMRLIHVYTHVRFYKTMRQQVRL
jgi:hypothetical protein